MERVFQSNLKNQLLHYEKIIQDKDKPIKGNALVKDEAISKIYDSSSSAMTHIIKSIKKYCPKRAHEFVIFS